MQELIASHLKPIVDEYRVGDDLDDVLRRLTAAHAEHLERLGPVRVLALDPCPICDGGVVASERSARCTGCGWSYEVKS